MDVEAIQLQGPGPHHARETGLGGGVVGLPEAAAQAGVGDDADYFAAGIFAGIVAHGLGGEAGAGEGALEVDGDHVVEFLFGHLEEGAVADDAGVVDQDVEAAEAVEGGLGELLGDRPVGHAAGDSRSGVANVAHHFSDQVRLGAVHHHLGAFGGERLGEAAAESTGGARHDGDLVFKQHRFPPSS